MYKYFTAFTILIIALNSFSSPQSNVINYINNIPETSFLNLDKIKKNLIEYYQAVQAIHSGANASIESVKNNYVLANPCFAEVAYKFYDDFLIEDLLKLATNPLFEYNVKLDEVANNPGSLWEKALIFSNGNKNLAMHLIGLCGHDDGVSEKPIIKIEDSRFTKLVEVRRLKLEKVKLVVQESKSISEDLRKNILNYIDDLTESEKYKISCNRRSFFMPKGLGVNIDITDALKIKIQQIQAPNKGMHILNAKYYHVIGAASLACELNENGAWSVIGPHIQQMSAVAYRGKRLCEVIDRFLNGQKFRNAESEREQAKFDAAYLWNKWYMRVKVGGNIGDICLSEPEKKPSVYNPVDIFNSLKNGNICASGWDNKRCENALKVMDEWEIDYIFTATQHRIGAEFGILQCKPLRDNETIESLACKAIENLK